MHQHMQQDFRPRSKHLVKMSQASYYYLVVPTRARPHQTTFGPSIHAQAARYRGHEALHNRHGSAYLVRSEYQGHADFHAPGCQQRAVIHGPPHVQQTSA